MDKVRGTKDKKFKVVRAGDITGFDDADVELLEILQDTDKHNTSTKQNLPWQSVEPY